MWSQYRHTSLHAVHWNALLTSYLQGPNSLEPNVTAMIKKKKLNFGWSGLKMEIHSLSPCTLLKAALAIPCFLFIIIIFVVVVVAASLGPATASFKDLATVVAQIDCWECRSLPTSGYITARQFAIAYQGVLPFFSSCNRKTSWSCGTMV